MILNGAAKGDGETVRAAAHSLKGSAQNLGLRTLAEFCVKIEAPSVEWSTADGSALADAFEQHARVVMRAVDARLQRMAE